MFDLPLKVIKMLSTKKIYYNLYFNNSDFIPTVESCRKKRQFQELDGSGLH